MPKSVNPLLRRKSSSPFSASPRRKPGVTRPSSLAKQDEASERLPDTGSLPSLIPANVSQDVISLIRYIQEQTWSEIPDRAAGMGSERISEVLRYRKTLPPVVSVAHLHALSASSTETEREIARLVARGALRKVTIPGRGKGGTAVGEGVVLTEDWIDRAKSDDALEQEIAEKYTALMRSHPDKATTPTSSLSDEEVRRLVRTGFLTAPGALSSSLGNLFTRPGESSLASLSKAGTTAATGSLAAVGGYGAVHESGGGGSTLATRDNRTITLRPALEMTFSLPATGNYLKLLTEARLHLLALLRQLSPRYREATLEFLHEKWDGNIPNDATSRAKRARGEWTGVLPGKTKKWRDFFGLEFDWVLAECVGSGLVELFETGSVGIAVRGI